MGDEPDATVEGFRAALAHAEPDEKARLLGKLMREARDDDVWHFTTVAEVRELLPKSSAIWAGDARSRFGCSTPGSAMALRSGKLTTLQCDALEALSRRALAARCSLAGR